MKMTVDNIDGKLIYTAITWREPDGGTFTGVVEGISSKLELKKPYIPKNFVIDVVPDGKGNYKLKNKNIIKEIKKYYKINKKKSYFL